MFENFDVFIQLDRTFRDLSGNKEESDSADLLRLWRNDKPTQWSDLLEEPRVIILSEAGSGKTTEIRQACRALRLNGKRAFFLRIEHLVQDFDTSFEEGTPEEFRDWVSSGEKGWLLLDSVDEARLKDPKDFERAIRTLGQRLRGVIQRAHIIISSRGEAWRPKTDLSLCETCLPCGIVQQCCPHPADLPAQSGFSPRLKTDAASHGVCLSPPPQQAFWRLSVLLSSAFLRHYDETKTLLNYQPLFCDIAADGGQLY
jgi:hypothetical protein